MTSKIKLLLLLLSLSLMGCKAKVKTVEVERLRTEYRDRLLHQHDSVYLHDSIYILQRGDTVYTDRWHTRYKEILRHDTTYLIRRDSISYPVAVEVERPRPWLQRVELNLYRVVILLLIIYLGWMTVRTLLWRRRL